jgi:NADH-quinone oxidoreductase subunit F
VSGQGKRQDLDLLLQITGQMANGMTICVFSDAAVTPVISGITKFRPEFEAYLAKAASPDFALSAPSDVTGKVAGRNAEGIHS